MGKFQVEVKIDMTKEFEPNIIGFLCNWCSYAGADLAGTSRMKYPPNIKSIRVMCSGRVDPVFVLEALRKGAEEMAIDPGRVRLEYISASEGNKFASVVTEFVDELKKMGPSPLKEVKA